MVSLTASMASQCHFCEEMQVRNISIAFLLENGGWLSDFVNSWEIESRLNIAYAFRDDRALAHRKTNFEIFHSASTHGSLVEDGSDNSDGLTSAPTSPLCAADI
jgi:hypothetical protein